MEKWLKIALSLTLVSSVQGLISQAGPLGAEFKLQETLGFDPSGSDEIDDFQLTQSSLRLKAEHSHGPWSWDAHLLLGANYSQSWQQLSTTLLPIPAKSLFDLDTEISGGSKGDLTLRIDRAALNYTAGLYTVKLGRQALTWGNGKFFNPMDRFDPFSPQAQDTSYKLGADMLYLQRLFNSGADLQVIYIPRRNSSTNRVDDALSSFAAKYLFTKGAWQIELIGAEDWDDKIAGVSAVGSIGSALWSTDIIYTHLAEGGDDLSLTTNLQHAWSWKGKPATGFVEYAHNGLGVERLTSSNLLPPALLARIARGQYFNTGRDYLGIGLSTQWSPLVTVAPSAIINLHDQSGILLINTQWNASNRDNLIIGLQAPFGNSHSEYGSSTNRTILYFRWESYF